MKKKKSKKNHRQVGKPHGATYADVLAYQRKKDEAIERAAQSAVTKVTSNQQAQRVQWIDIIAAHEAFGIGPERFGKFFECAIEISNEVERMRAEVDDEYAWEKLRERAAKVSGINFSYVYEGEYKP